MEESFVSNIFEFEIVLLYFLWHWSAVNWKCSGWKQVWNADFWAQTGLHLLPGWFIQLAGWEPEELTALWAESSTSQLKNNIALTEMATVCLFFQQKGVKKQILVLVVTEKVKNQREKE